MKQDITPLEIIRKADGMRLEDEDGNIDTLTLLPPLTKDEISELEQSIPCPLPDDIRELLQYTSGFDGILESLYFGGQLAGFGLEEIFPHAFPIAHDGFGNYWIIDLLPTSTTWGPIFYACHDAPVIVYQTYSFTHFLSEVIRLGNPPWESEINDVHEKFHDKIWNHNPDTMTYEQCLNSDDPELIEFAKSLDEMFLFVDLRNAKTGDGFSWGRYGGNTVNKRHGQSRVFAYQIKKTFWQRLFAK